jgi:Zn-finger nucleic acid-binding protein
VTEQSAQGFFIFGRSSFVVADQRQPLEGNHMELEGQDLIFLELKYCERCGGLWLRTAGTEDLYCSSCAIEMFNLARPMKRRYGPRFAANHKTELNNAIHHGPLAIVSGKGGNA